MLDAKKHTKAIEEANQWLVRLQSPELSSNEESAFFAWLESAPENQFAYIQAEKAWEMGGDTQALKMLENTKPSTAKPRERERQSWFFFSAWQGAGLACACLLLVGLAVYFPNHMQAPEPYQVITGVGEQTTVTLDDGSTVFLNTDTVITVAYNNERRLIILEKGEAFFDVQSDPVRAFDVEMESGLVRVLGTQFSVQVKDDDAVVTVLEGRVGLDSAEEESGDSAESEQEKVKPFKPDATLQANQQLSISSAAKKETPKTIDAKAALEWRSGRLVFRGDPLSEVVSQLNRYFNNAISIGDKNLASLKVIAVIHIGNLGAAITTLEKSLNIRSEKDEEGHITLLPQE